MERGTGPPLIHGRDFGPPRHMGRDGFTGRGGRTIFGRGDGGGPLLNGGRGDPRDDPRGGHFPTHQRPAPPPPQVRDILMQQERGRGQPPMMNHHQPMGQHLGMQHYHGMQMIRQQQPPPMHHPNPLPHMTQTHMMHESHSHFQQGPPQGQYLQNHGPPQDHGTQFKPHQPHQLPTPQNVLSAPVQLPSSSYSKEQIDQAWTEGIAPNLMKYYYNSILQESTYTMPPVLILKAQHESNVATPAQAATQNAWIEYSDPNTGKTYYSNGVSTTWEKPDGFGISDESRSKDDDEPPTKKKKLSAKKETSFGSKSEAQAAFKGLLLAKAVTPTNKWNEVVKMCSTDSRWDACEILSLGERKQALAEYQTKRSNELKNQEREERKRAKDAFVDLLTETLPLVATFNALTTRLGDMRDSLSKDDRFYAVEDEGTRESLFLEFCEEVRKRDERKKRNKKREMKEAFLAVLKDHEEKGNLTFASTWSSFLASLEKDELNDPRFLASSLMSDSDRELYFSDYVIELQTAEDEKRRRIREARKRAETAQREAFCETLRRLATEGQIEPFSRWRAVEGIISAESTFGPVQEQDRNAPRDLYEDFVGEWNNRYQKDRSFISRLLHPPNSSGQSSTVVTAESTFDEFKEKLLSSSAAIAIDYQDSRHILNTEDPVSSARVFFNELLAKVKGNLLPSDQKLPHRSLAVEQSSEDEGEIIEDDEEIS